MSRSKLEKKWVRVAYTDLNWNIYYIQFRLHTEDEIVSSRYNLALFVASVQNNYKIKNPAMAV